MDNFMALLPLIMGMKNGNNLDFSAILPQLLGGKPDILSILSQNNDLNPMALMVLAMMGKNSPQNPKKTQNFNFDEISGFADENIVKALKILAEYSGKGGFNRAN